MKYQRKELSNLEKFAQLQFHPARIWIYRQVLNQFLHRRLHKSMNSTGAHSRTKICFHIDALQGIQLVVAD
jgi:hypothetical protein